jgi:hypothetical protein
MRKNRMKNHKIAQKSATFWNISDLTSVAAFVDIW